MSTGSLGTIKASQVVVLNEDSVVVTQRKLVNSMILILKVNLTSLRNINVIFVEHHTHFNAYVSQRNPIQFEDEDYLST